ncbi:hypothetical protein FGRMN_2165 [Fusarium graminum]|nr:hypothetical protein FGRMN_2165 [Fusarium graminum]
MLIYLFLISILPFVQADGAQEGGGSAEAELCSSTSRDVCELYNNGGIARVFGRPKILEIVFDPNDKAVNGDACGIYTFPQYRCGERAKEEWDFIHDDEKQSAPSPNLSLNIGIKRKSRTVFRTVAAVGTILQVGVLVFAVYVTYYLQWEKEGSRPDSYACPITIVGTLLLFLGIFLCAFLIGESTDEKVFDRKPVKDSDRMNQSIIYWLQPGGQVLGDQVFDPFCCSDYKEPLQQYVTSWKYKTKDWTLLVWTAVGTTIAGFTLQFIGLRGLHSVVSVFQLGVMLSMSAARAALRMQRLKPEDNYLAKFPDIVTGHELDWLAIRLHQNQCRGRSPSEVVGDSDDTKARCLWRFRGVHSGKESITKESPGSHPSEPNDASRVLAYRTRLAKLSRAKNVSLSSTTSVEHFSNEMVAVRDTARKLVTAMESIVNTLFEGGAKLKDNWTDATSVCWTFDCEVLSNVPKTRQALLGSSEQQTLPLYITKRGEDGRWALENELTIEGILGLWVWSLKFDPLVQLPDTEKNLELSQATEIRSRRVVSAGKEIAEADLKAWLGGSVLKFTAADISQTLSGHNNPNTMWEESANSWQVAKSVSSLDNKQRFFGWHTTKLTENQHATPITVWSASITSSLTVLCAQEVFGSFLKSLCSILDYFSEVDIETHAQELPLVRELASKLVNAFVESGLGSRDEALLSIVPLFISPLEIPRTKGGLESARDCADKLRRQRDWETAEMVLRRSWSTCIEWKPVVPDEREPPQAVEDAKRTAIALGELYRWALKDHSATNFGRNGIHWLSERRLSLTPEFRSSIGEVIDRYDEVLRGVYDPPPSYVRGRKPALEIGSDRTSMLINLTLPTSANWTLQSKGNALCLAAKQGWVEIVLALLEMGAVPESRGPDDIPALSCAAQSQDIEIFEVLLKGGAPPNARDPEERTPLTWAAGSGNLRAVELLIDNAEVDVTIENRSGDTALWWAADGGHVDVMMLLSPKLSGRAADLNVENEYFTTPLIRAVKSQREAAVQMLLDIKDIKFNARDDRDRSALWHAAYGGHEAITGLLLQKPGISYVADESGQTPLDVAVAGGHDKVVKLLLDMGEVSPEQKNVFKAAEKGHQEIIRLLLERGSNVNVTDEDK